MDQLSLRRRLRVGASPVVALIAIIALASGLLPRATAFAALSANGSPTANSAARAGGLHGNLPALDSLRGLSGRLFMRFVSRGRASMALPAFQYLFGDAALGTPGIYPLRDSSLRAPLAFVAMYPFSSKHGDRIGPYRIGFWPAERGQTLSGPHTGYANPEGFIEVTPENVNERLSEHFRLRDFVTHDQSSVWPKYLVLRDALLDKLELVITELERRGVTVKRMVVMSGFRTPQYNATGGETGGRAGLSRHMYGDAADVFVDNDGTGRMSDLNHDGRVDARDAEVIRSAVDAVERAHPDLVGGVGVYRATRSHGPFTHVDVRGYRARWGVNGEGGR